MARFCRRRGSCEPEGEPIVHSGVLFKRGYGRLLGRKGWKPRHFELTRSKLRYFVFENGKLRDEIDLRRCPEDSFEIMPIDARKTGSSKSTVWRLALNVPGRPRLLMAAPTEREMNEWIKQLGNALRELHRKKTQAPSQISADAIVGDHQHDDEETKEEEEEMVVVPRPVLSNQSDAMPLLEENGLDPRLASSWKTTTTDFQNFVAQPRRSMIFRRHSFEGQPIEPGVYRHSTGQIDDQELQTELEELCSNYVLVNSDDGGLENDDEMNEEEEEALLRALRAFSSAHSDRLDTNADAENPVSSEEDDLDRNRQNVEEDEATLSRAPVRPIFHYRKEEASDQAATRSVVAGSHDGPRKNSDLSEDPKWYARLSGKLHRDSDVRDSIVASPRETVAKHGEDDEDLLTYFKEDPAASKPRRFSTGSMLLTSERLALAQERDSENAREEALIQELLAGLVFNHYDELSQDFSSTPRVDDGAAVDGGGTAEVETQPIARSASSDSDASRASDGHTTTASSAPSSTRPSLSGSDGFAALPPTSPEGKNQVAARGRLGTNDSSHGEHDGEGDSRDKKWFKRFKAKWRASRDEEKARKQAERAEKRRKAQSELTLVGVPTASACCSPRLEAGTSQNDFVQTRPCRR